MKTLLPEAYLNKWDLWRLDKAELQEIRLRVGKRLRITYQGLEKCYQGIIVSKTDIEQIFQWLCGYGVYAYQDEIAKGFITIQGGHRVGLGGQVLSDLSGKVNHMKYISSILIRVSHDIRGVAEPVLDKLYEEGRLKNVLLLSPPGCGKTTMLRDLVRQISNGNAFGMGQNISVIDERDELAAVYMGVPEIDVGERTDVISGCDKKTAMEMCLRALGPQAVAVDELYSEGDLEAVKRLHGCGCIILATHHAESFKEFSKKPFGKAVLKEKLFERFVVLGKEEGRYVVKAIQTDTGAYL